MSTVGCKLSIVLPTYNECENIRRLIPRLSTVFEEIPHEIIVVDDQSVDGTPEAVRELKAAGHAVWLLPKEKKEGIGAALRIGYDQSKGSLIASMDADLSFKPEDLKAMYRRIQEIGAGLIVGNRHSKESFYEAAKLSIRIKRWISANGNWFLRTITRIPLGDFSANFRVIKKEVWKQIETKEKTNMILFEMILATWAAGFYVDQVPVSFLDRRFGKSKLNLLSEVPKFLFKLGGYLLRYRSSLYGRHIPRRTPAPTFKHQEYQNTNS